MIEANPGLKEAMDSPRLKSFYDFNQFEYKISYEDLYEDWFIEQVYGNASAKLFKQQFIKKLSKNMKISYIFSSRDLRRRFKKA